ncbi:MAG: hypothetical protein A3K10_08855 [Bacteroidetes bacterium RIFCSPLOWO2_12_FULL_31_6]|nr:MAG: hypothetical protein A3K10_08855 [Bacteroidetes bacterium RIFCSPLOWO2_12_FULL_31_6]
MENKIVKKLEEIEEIYSTINCKLLDKEHPISITSSSSVSKLLFNSYYNNSNITESLIEQHVNFINQSKNSSSKYSTGIPGYSTLLYNLYQDGKVDFHKSFFNQLDEINRACLNSVYKTSERNNDFLHGIIGNSVYFFFRVKENYNSLKKIQELIENQKKKDKDYAYWETLNQDGKKSVELGLAHGHASKLWFLNNLYLADINPKQAKQTIKQGVNYILSLRNADDVNTFSIFPTSIQKEKGSEKSRLAWCNGDLSIAIILYQISETLNDQNLKDEAINIAIKTTLRKDVENTRLFDTAFCHGISGVVHLYNKFYQMTKIESFRIARDYWVNKLIDEGDPKNYTFLYIDKWVKDYGLLNGLGGVGMSLLGLINPKELSWDRLFLLS